VVDFPKMGNRDQLVNPSAIQGIEEEEMK